MCIYLFQKKKKGENNSKTTTKTRQAVKAEILCEALGSVPVCYNTLPPCLAVLFWQAGKIF